MAEAVLVETDEGIVNSYPEVDIAIQGSVRNSWRKIAPKAVTNATQPVKIVDRGVSDGPIPACARNQFSKIT